MFEVPRVPSPLPLLLILCLSPALGLHHAAAATGSGARLFDVSQELIRAFNSHDAAAILKLLSPALKSKYSKLAILEVIARCKDEKIAHVERTSLPVSGTQYYGFFGVYGRAGVLTMILEIDRENRIVFWAVDHDFESGVLSCSLNDFKRNGS